LVGNQRNEKGSTQRVNLLGIRIAKIIKKHTEDKVGRRLLIDRLIDEKCDRLIKNKNIIMPQEILNALAGHSINEEERKLSLGQPSRR
jgi:hypothetical protein